MIFPVDLLLRIFRPRALPLVAPFGLKAPPSTLVLSDFFTVDVNLRNEPAVEIAGTFSSGYLHAWTSKNGQFASLDITLTCPSPGIWFIGSLFTDSSFSVSFTDYFEAILLAKYSNWRGVVWDLSVTLCDWDPIAIQFIGYPLVTCTFLCGRHQYTVACPYYSVRCDVLD